MKRLVIFMMVVLMATACTTEKPTADFLRVEGENIVTPTGEKYFIRGTNLGNWLNPEGYMFHFRRTNSARRINDALCELVGEEYMRNFWREFKDNYITREDIAYIASTGANTIRAPFHYRLFTNEDYMGLTVAQDGFERIDSLVEWCRAEGLHIILDMHDCPGGQTGDNIDDSYGYPWLFESTAEQERFIEIWCRIAEHYADEPVILGYDLMNEPLPHYLENKEVLNPLVEPLLIRTAKAVREIDKNHILLFAGAQWNSNFNIFTDWSFDDNLMYTCHTYGCPPEVGSLAHFSEFMAKSNRPMYMGETGENSDEWVGSMRAALEECNIGWTFWTYKRLAAGACFVSIPMPEGWQTIVDFVESDRLTYEAARNARPDQVTARAILDQYLVNCRFENCAPNGGYTRALFPNR